MSNYYNQQQPVQMQQAYPASTTVYYASPTVVTHQQTNATPKYALNYSRVTSTSLGAAQLFMAAVSITGGIMAFVYEASMDHIGAGIWCGIFYLIAGSVALAAGQNPTNSLITSTALLSGLDVAFGITEVTIAAIGLSNDVWCYAYECITWKGGAVAANCLMVGAGSWQVVFGIWLFAVSCRAVYGGSSQQVVVSAAPVTYTSNTAEAVFLQSPGQMPPQQYYHQPQYPGHSNQQQMTYPHNPPAPQMQLKEQSPPYPGY